MTSPPGMTPVVIVEDGRSVVETLSDKWWVVAVRTTAHPHLWAVYGGAAPTVSLLLKSHASDFGPLRDAVGFRFAGPVESIRAVDAVESHYCGTRRAA